ncbi:hypothetical protein CISIN_1g047762mg [Citrus sinensis]|uniref:Uncharacterized protein n=1 Tax=Citrus sinensis TaxID=2711 RepID=A0A067FC23_CITSI|nr:hypothetical protein CISIN_1g047762mg [Citrus sinensis]
MVRVIQPAVDHQISMSRLPLSGHFRVIKMGILTITMAGFSFSSLRLGFLRSNIGPTTSCLYSFFFLMIFQREHMCSRGGYH